MEATQNVDFQHVQYILTALIGSSSTLSVEGNLMLKDEDHVGLGRDNPLWKDVSPIDSILSGMNQAKVHVFSDSVLYRGNNAMNAASYNLQNKHGRKSGETRNDMSYTDNLIANTEKKNDPKHRLSKATITHPRSGDTVLSTDKTDGSRWKSTRPSRMSCSRTDSTQEKDGN